MNNFPFLKKYFTLSIIAIFLIFLGVACLPVAAPIVPTPILQTVVVTQEVTREVTRIVDVPVTVTPTPTPTDTDTPTFTPTSADTPTVTPTPVPAGITMLIHTGCLFGPDPAYIRRYDVLEGSQQVAIGRSQDSSWLYVQGADHKYPCWVKAGLVKVDSGSLGSAVVSSPVLLPYTTLYPPPQAVSTNRVGNDVTIFWLPVPMTEADYNGYLIEARVCQGGQLVFVPNELHPDVRQEQHHDGRQCHGRSRLLGAFQRPHLYRHDELPIRPGKISPGQPGDAHANTETATQAP